jgi:hypothetical protein
MIDAQPSSATVASLIVLVTGHLVVDGNVDAPMPYSQMFQVSCCNVLDRLERTHRDIVVGRRWGMDRNYTARRQGDRDRGKREERQSHLQAERSYNSANQRKAGVERRRTVWRESRMPSSNKPQRTDETAL